MNVLPYIVAGVVTGSLFGLAATGLVLSYQTSGMFNFAHGAVGAAAAYAFHDLYVEHGVAWPLALALVLLVLGPAIGLLLSAVALRLAEAGTVRRVAASVGLLLVLQGVLQLRYGVASKATKSPFSTKTVDIAGTLVGYDQLITIAIALASVTGLVVLLRRTRLGLAMRAAVDDPELLSLTGRPPAVVRTAAWVLGASFAALTGVLFAPTVGLDYVLLSVLVVQAVGAAAVGRFRSLGATFAGGVAIGVAQALLRSPDVRDWFPFLDSVPNLDQSVPFLVLFGVLLGARGGAFVEPGPPRVRAASSRIRPGRIALAVAATVAALAAVPELFSSRLLVFSLGAVFVVVFASLFLLVDLSGQVSLCQTSFVAIGACTFAHLTTGAGLPWGVGAVGAALVALPVGALVAVPAIRVSGLYLALATLSFGVLVESMLYNQGILFGTFGTRRGERPHVLGLETERGYFWFCAGIAALAILTVVVVRRSRMGRLLHALAEAPVALTTHGASAQVTRVLVFCLASAMAAVAGVLYIGVVGSISSSGASNTTLVSVNSLVWLAVLLIAGRSAVLAPILAAVALVVAPSFNADPELPRYLTIAFGTLATVVAAFGPDVRTWLADVTERAADRARRSPVAARWTLHRPGVAADA